MVVLDVCNFIKVPVGYTKTLLYKVTVLDYITTLLIVDKRVPTVSNLLKILRYSFPIDSIHIYLVFASR